MSQKHALEEYLYGSLNNINTLPMVQTDTQLNFQHKKLLKLRDAAHKIFVRIFFTTKRS